MRKLSKAPAIKIVAFSMMFSIAMLPLTANRASAQLRVESVTQYGLGGEPVANIDGSCPGTTLPSCTSGHTCECIIFTPMLQPAGEGKAVAIRPADARPLAEIMLVDLTDSSSNGLGGLCWPWNGLGAFHTSKANGFTISEQGHLCQNQDPSEFTAVGTFDFEDGTGAYSDPQGRGTISFNLEPTPGAANGSSSPAILFPIAFVAAAVVAWVAIAVKATTK